MTLKQLLKDLRCLQVLCSKNNFGEYYKKESEKSYYLTPGVKSCLKFGIKERDF